MITWWETLPLLQQVFYLIAIPSTLVLFLQTILLLFGLGDGHGDGDVGHDFGGHDHDFGHDAAGPHGDFVPAHDTAHDTAHDQGADHEAGLRILTVRGIVAFLSLFGWVGVAALDMGASAGVAFLLALLAGLAAMFVVAAVLKASLKLQQSGNIDMRNALGLTGEVYVPIPKGGKGKITMIFQERFQELDATCLDRPLKTGESVKVVGVNEANTLIVEPLSAAHEVVWQTVDPVSQNH